MDKRTRQRLISALIFLGFIAIGAFVFYKLSGMKKSTVSSVYTAKAKPKVLVSTFETTSVPNTIEIDGRLRAAEQVGIFSKVNGILEQGSSTVKEGKYYSKGDLLFRVNDQEANYNLLAQKSTLLTNITQMMPDLKFDYPEGFQKWQNYLDNFDVSQSLKELPKVTDQKEKYYVGGKNIYNLFYNIKSLETRLRDYYIYAPFSGVVTQVNIYPGALVNPGSNLATMINTSYFELLGTATLEELKYIKTGQKVNLFSTDLDKSWTGTISRIGSQIDNATQNIPLYISVSGRGLKDGMYLQGTVDGKTIEDITVLPKNVFVNPESVYIVQDSTIVAKEIKSVKRLKDKVLIRGLSPDDKVITGSLAGLYEGQKVSY